MRLFHVSEEPDIQVFEPRLPKRSDLDPATGLVWSIEESKLSNFLTPRNSPRVAYHVSSQTTDSDKDRFFSSSSVTHALVIENRWFQTMRNTTLFLYEFTPTDFSLLDRVAGYYTATTTQYPIQKYVLNDLLQELIARNVEVRIVDHLWDLADAVKGSTLDWSLCRMANAKPRP